MTTNPEKPSRGGLIFAWIIIAFALYGLVSLILELGQ